MISTQSAASASTTARRRAVDATHYDTLRLTPTASPADVFNGYRQQRTQGHEGAEVERAYAVLSDHSMRRLYDASLRAHRAAGGRPETIPPPRATSWTRSAMVLLLALTVAAAAAAWPLIQRSRSRFPPGTDLVRRHDGQFYGRVLAYRPAHAFPGGQRLPAYQVFLASEAVESWLPRDEVNQVARPAPGNARPSSPQPRKP